MRQQIVRCIFHLVVSLLVVAGISFATVAPVKHHRRKPSHALAAASKASTSATKASITTRVRRGRAVARHSPWGAPTYADSTAGDRVDGEDLAVRRAAVEALGPYNGTVLAVDANTGRILTMVNQKLALAGGFQPCSTVKIAVALAALSEGVIDRVTPVHLYGRTRMDLTQALAHSNNFYFANLGIKLGYERWAYYARLFGLGEKAGLDIPGEEPGFFASEPPSSGMGMMTSFGDGIRQTPLELAALLAAVDNGGTLYYLQYPQNAKDTEQFVPRVKRHLDIAQFIPQLKPGMEGAVEFGTARRAVYDSEAPVCGKTGTCTGGTAHLGWFGSFNDFGQNRIVTVVLLTGARGVSGPMASQIAGAFYRKLAQEGYLGHKTVFSPAVLIPR
ncbi:MAG: penicillin-binding transpeptidase domain-containing protein [Bryobacteraceae bacterium]|jgi:cell division protein FtsI/penicillin-binding protein 2